MNLVDLPAELDHIPSHFKTLMSYTRAGCPSKPCTPFDQFVLGGGKLMMFIDPLSALDTDAPPPPAPSWTGCWRAGACACPPTWC